MIRVAVVEDEREYAEQLEEYLHRYEKEHQETFSVTYYSDGDGIVQNFKGQFDIILLDIQMAFMNGMSAAEEIRKQDTQVVIIFITNMKQYALRGYAVDALDYVLKPVNYFAFSQRLARAVERIHRRVSKTIIVNIKGGMVKLDVSDICYLESVGHSLIFHTVSGRYETWGTMKSWEAELRDSHFVLGNKGYLINLAYVDSVRAGVVTVHGEELVLSRSKKTGFMEELNKYWSDVK